MRPTKNDMARAIVQALRRQGPVSPNDPEVVKLATKNQTSQLASDYKRALNSIEYRRKNG